MIKLCEYFIKMLFKFQLIIALAGSVMICGVLERVFQARLSFSFDQHVSTCYWELVIYSLVGLFIVYKCVCLVYECWRYPMKVDEY